MQNELFTRMQYEPSILIFGKNYRNIDTAVLDHAWNAVATTNCDLDLSAALKNDKRFVRDITSKNDMQANLLDKKNLHVIRLFGESYPKENLDELDAEDVIDKAVSMLTRIAEIINRNGIAIIEDFEEPYFTHKEFRKAFRLLFHNQKQVYFFNIKTKDQYLESLVSQGIAVLFEENISSFFEQYFIEDDSFDLQSNDQTIQIYMEAGKKAIPTSIPTRQLLETESFTTLLNIGLLNEIKIPENMYKDYFYTFLKNSVREPQWYGYSYGFNLHRNYEDRLYRKVKKGLENVGNPSNKPLLVVGQTGTGKSIALAAVAYKIFNEKRYPVLYINNPDINFYSSVEYKKKGINRTGSQAFNALDALAEKLENLGAKAILLIWDTSSYSSGRERCYRLYQQLLARGRKIYLLSSAYELNNQSISNEIKEEYVEESVMNRKFVECYADVEMSSEVEQLRDILLNKCNVDYQSVNEILNYYAVSSTNYLYMFYQAFDILRGDLSKGVFKEASVNLREIDKFLDQGINDTVAINNIFALALKKAENELIKAGVVEKVEDADNFEKQKINVAKDNFIKCIAICSQFKLKMPYDFALRILGTYNQRIIQTLTKSTFFVITQDYHGNYEISLRTPLEANMYISAKNMTTMDEIECVIKLLKEMKPSSGYGQQQEVRLCEKLIRIVGPNNAENRNRYRKGYPEIINALKDLREDRNIWEPILISQEITYIREFYGHNENLDTKEIIRLLEEAVGIADKVLNKIEYSGISMGTRNAIVVESANSKLLLCQLKESNDASLFRELRRDLRNVIRYDSLAYHAYVTLLKGSVIEYKNESDKIKRIELLEAMCSIADEIMFENPDVANSEYFQRQVTEIYSLLNTSETVKSYIEELVSNGSSAGLYIMARKMLIDNNVDFKKAISNELQESACKKVYDLFNTDRYKAVLAESEPCQYMLINIIWLMNNREPIYLEGECWLTKMKEEVWRELLYICNNFIMKFCSNAEDTHQLAKNIRYIKALCLGELGQYFDSISVLKSIEEDSSLGIRRVFTKHMLCEEDGSPRKFTGRLGKYDEVNRNGSIYIEEFGKNPIYYHGPHMKSTNLVEGTVFKDIEIGYSIIAPKAFREIEIEE